MDEVGLDGSQRLVLHEDGVGLVPLGAHQRPEPRLLRELRRRLRREVHLVCRNCGCGRMSLSEARKPARALAKEAATGLP